MKRSKSETRLSRMEIPVGVYDLRMTYLLRKNLSDEAKNLKCKRLHFKNYLIYT